MDSEQHYLCKLEQCTTLFVQTMNSVHHYLCKLCTFYNTYYVNYVHFITLFVYNVYILHYTIYINFEQCTPIFV